MLQDLSSDVDEECCDEFGTALSELEELTYEQLEELTYRLSCQVN